MSRLWIRGFLLSPVLVFLFATNLYAQNNFVYTNDDVLGPNTVSGFAVMANGTLGTVPGSPFPTGGTGTGGGHIAVNRAATCPAQQRIYVSNAGSNDVSGFSVDLSTGGLTLVPGSPFPTGGRNIGGIALACTPDGRFIMAANSGSGGSSDIMVFSIAADSGALTPVGSRALDFPPEGIKISPDGKFLAAALPLLNAIAMLSIAPDGTLTPLPDSPFLGASADGALAGVDINCASSVMFGGSTALTTTTVDVFDIATSGALTSRPDSPFTPGVGLSSSIVLLSPNERLLFVSNQLSNSVTVASVASNPSLALVAGSPFDASGSIFPGGMAMDQAGNFLYVADRDKVYGYSVGNDGVLTPVPDSPFQPNQPSRALSLTSFPGKTCNQPPDCSAAAARPSTVWPPNGEMVRIGLSGVTDPDGDPVTVKVTSVSNNEQRYGGCTGDATCSPLAVRAERDGDGRVYTIQLTASDGRGGACTGAVKVCVPHSQGSNNPCGGGDND